LLQIKYMDNKTLCPEYSHHTLLIAWLHIQNTAETGINIKYLL